LSRHDAERELRIVQIEQQLRDKIASLNELEKKLRAQKAKV
jgi:hypothetical protein